MDETYKDRVLLTALEGWRYIGGERVISHGGWYAALGRGEIPSKRLGKKILIPKAALLEWIASARPAAAVPGVAAAQAGRAEGKR